MEYTETERRILDMWPKYEDGEYVMYEDEFGFDGDVKTAYGFNFGVGGRVSICSDKGSHVRLPNGERVKRPAPKALDADGVRSRAQSTFVRCHRPAPHRPGGRRGVLGQVLRPRRRRGVPLQAGAADPRPARQLGAP